jgi:hypothetical protein
MAARITDATTKTGIVIVGWIAVFMLGLTSALLMGGVGGTIASVVLALAVVLFCARTFRAPGEPIAPPRPWWKLTGGRTSGLVVGGLCVLQVVGQLASARVSDGAGGTLPAALLYAVLAVAFVHSALRQPPARKTAPGA